MFVDDDSGQAFVLEMVVAAVIIVSTVLFAIQATAVTPLTISTSHQHIETQQKKIADGVLERATIPAEDGEVTALEEAVLYWDLNEQTFYDASEEGYRGEYPDTTFGNLLAESFEDKQIATNVYVTYSRGDGTSSTEPMIIMGEPSNNAMSASTTVIINDDDEITAPGHSGAVSETSRFYAPNVDEDSNVYNVMKVRIEVWRI